MNTSATNFVKTVSSKQRFNSDTIASDSMSNDKRADYQLSRKAIKQARRSARNNKNSTKSL